MDNNTKPYVPPSKEKEPEVVQTVKVPAQSRLKEELLKPMPSKNVNTKPPTQIIIPAKYSGNKQSTTRLAAGTKIILPSNMGSSGQPLQFIVTSPQSSSPKVTLQGGQGQSLITGARSILPNLAGRPCKIIVSSPPSAVTTEPIYLPQTSANTVQYIVTSPEASELKTISYEEDNNKYIIENTENESTEEIVVETQNVFAPQEITVDVPTDTDAANSLIAIAEQLQQPKVENFVYMVDDKGDNSGIIAEHAVVGDDIEPAEVEVESVEVEEIKISPRRGKKAQQKRQTKTTEFSDDASDLSDTDMKARISNIGLDHLSYLSSRSMVSSRPMVYSPQAKERQAAFTSDESTDSDFSDDDDDEDYKTRRVKKPTYKAKKPSKNVVSKTVNSWMKKFVPKVSPHSDAEENSDDNEDYSDIGVPKEHLMACCERFRKVTESVEELMRNNAKTRSFRETTNPSGDRVFECSTCHKLFTMRDTIKKHLIRHTGQRCFQCTKCNKNFMFKYGLKCHMMTHTGKMPCVCSICGGKFIENSKLEVHMRRVHTSERPFECAQCDKKYPTKSELNNHILNVHTTIKPYPCPFCDKKFSHDAKLKRHLTVHTGERPFKCSFCEKAFTQRAHLQIHERCHTGIFPFACNGCDRRFYDKVSRDRHYRRIHEGVEKPYCKKCNSYFKTKTSLTRHKRECGRIKQEPPVVVSDEDDVMEDEVEEDIPEPRKRATRVTRSPRSKKLTIKIKKVGGRKTAKGKKSDKKVSVEAMEKSGKLFIRSERIKARSEAAKRRNQQAEPAAPPSKRKRRSR
ncbi:zinc finger protein 69 homolog [Saccostrea echinata]|uniref:zinc finger protein 69 homolog n=1 Tax=Saccostrea echinata TaxID=191078 RepID=UPI002A7EB6A2|nr:zinc finger protein 69 homolog [Saccostrea echinata]XP_061189349.1 zinc finger protein 69 homolog [Saccostrea echinata]